jgi:hypothetical protein
MRQPPPKKSRARRADPAKGGSGPNQHMFGRGDRTKTAPGEQASKQQPSSTAHKTSGRGEKFAEGGTMPRSGGLASPAKSEHTGPPGATARSSTRNYSKGGEARPARPGQCGT